MATIKTEEAGVGGSLEGASSEQQHCQFGEALAEWRSSEQVENGIPSTSPPFWDCDSDDEGPKPSELFGKTTWKIDKFSKINKRELRSNAFEVGGYKWYILIYPQGCDVFNHLSLFLCVANHDKLLPGWSHFAQFTIAVVNKDLKKSKYSDTLHRFWKKEHDWGWKKFMELSKLFDGFLDSDTLIIKAQVQVIRERANRPFRCLDYQYRRELVRVYLTNVEQIYRQFVEERRCKLGKLIEDKARWSSFCAFWLGMDQNSRRRMSREKSDPILKVVVKHFFVDKEVTSTLVMDSLYSGLKTLEGHYKGKNVNVVEQYVRVEEDTFVLVEDVVVLLERAALEQLPTKDEKAPQNRTKDGASGDDFINDTIECDEMRLTELGRWTIEIFVLAQIFSNIEVAYREAVALKMQEELIREEEEAEGEQKSKRGTCDKDKKSKKKQAKQKRNNRKAKKLQSKASVEHSGGEGKAMTVEPEVTLDKAYTHEEVLDIADLAERVPQVLNPESDDKDVDDNSSTCSTDGPQPQASSHEQLVVKEVAAVPLQGKLNVTDSVGPSSDETSVGPSATRSADSPIKNPSKLTNKPFELANSPLAKERACKIGQVGPSSSPATQSYAAQPYRMATLAPPAARSSSGFSQHHSPSSAMRAPQFSTPLVNSVRNLDLHVPVNSTSDGHLASQFPVSTSEPLIRQPYSALGDEFPHLDIINDLLDDEYGIGITSEQDLRFPTQQFAFPREMGNLSGLGPGPSMRPCRFQGTQRFHHSYSVGFMDTVREVIPLPSAPKGQMVDGLCPNCWPSYHHASQCTNTTHSVNGYRMFPPSNGF